MARRFDIALSFPGEHRPYVEQIANELADALTRARVFYDRFHEAELSRPNLDTYLQDIYYRDSRLVVVILCKEYDKKEWCGLEFRAIRELIKQRHDDEIMFVRVAEGEVKGIFGIDGYVDAKDRPSSEVARIILDRLVLLGDPASGSTPAKPGIVAGSIRPALSVVGSATQPPPHRPLLRDLERALTSGELKDSELGPLVYAALEHERHLELVTPYDPQPIMVGIRIADYYFRLIRSSAGDRDWQRDFAKTVTPVLVVIAHTLRRSSDAQAVIVNLCDAVARQLRLKLIWPADPDDLNDVRNELYRDSVGAHEIESDAVLLILQRLTVIGPS